MSVIYNSESRENEYEKLLFNTNILVNNIKNLNWSIYFVRHGEGTHNVNEKSISLRLNKKKSRGNIL